MEFTFGIAIGAIVAAILTITYNIYSARNQRKIERKESVNLLFGELLNVICHYEFFEIPSRLVDGPNSNHDEVVKRLELCKYGSFKAAENTQSYSFLNATQVRNIHQLSLRIRNTDLLIERYLKSDGNDIDLFHWVQSRMDYINVSAGMLLDYISEIHPEYKKLIEDTKNLDKPTFRI